MFELCKKIRDRRHRRCRSTARKSRRSPTGRLGVESLEQRQLMAADLGLGMGPALPPTWPDFRESISLDVEAGLIDIVGSPGSDTASVSDYRGGYRVTLNSATTDIPAADAAKYSRISFAGGYGGDTFTNSTSLSSTADGGAGGDTLTGGSGADTLSGGDGNDTIAGRGGNDTITGDAGDDTLHGSEGDDSIQGGAGTDTLYGGSGADEIDGGDDGDSIDGDSGDDTIDGGAGSDTIDGGADSDTIRGGSESDILSGGSGNDTIEGGDGNDTINGNEGADDLHGGDGTDDLHGGTGSDSLAGDADNDELYGDADGDVLHGGSGDDDLYGGDGGDDLYGDSGDDVLKGMDGDDGLYGGAGSDELYGGDNEDRFLVTYGNREDEDKTGSDALLTFRDGDTGWSEDEIEAIDEAFATLHRYTGDKTLLERKSGNDLTIYREAVHPDSTATSSVLGMNNDGGEIYFYDAAFSSSVPVIQVVFHEIGHNWDDESSVWSEFKDASGWDAIGWREDRDSDQSTSGDAEWYYDRGADFVEDYGANNPYDDFACVFALFFMDQHGDDYYADRSFESTADLIDDISDDDDDADKWDLVSEYLASL
jgi:Ca2+-binding RTX toxin-like protein